MYFAGRVACLNHVDCINGSDPSKTNIYSNQIKSAVAFVGVAIFPNYVTITGSEHSAKLPSPVLCLKLQLFNTETRFIRASTSVH